MSSAAMFFTWSVERSSRLFGPSDYEQFGVVHLDLCGAGGYVED